jgi:hypothetical protein
LTVSIMDTAEPAADFAAAASSPARMGAATPAAPAPIRNLRRLSDSEFSALWTVAGAAAMGRCSDGAPGLLVMSLRTSGIRIIQLDAIIEMTCAAAQLSFGCNGVRVL